MTDPAAGGDHGDGSDGGGGSGGGGSGSWHDYRNALHLPFLVVVSALTVGFAVAGFALRPQGGPPPIPNSEQLLICTMNPLPSTLEVTQALMLNGDNVELDLRVAGPVPPGATVS